jgi:clan AA aspartic protease
MAEEKGLVNENLEAVLEIRLVNGSAIKCVIDTGFNGSLLLPRNFVETNSMLFVGSEEAELVEGITAEIETALADIKWFDEEFSARIFVSEADDALIGTEMLTGSLLEIDYKNNTVKITK